MGEKQTNGLIRRDRNAQYIGLIIFALVISSGMVILKLRDIQPGVETEPDNLVDFSTVQLIMETDKEVYELGESIDTSIYVYNPTSEDVWILPISNYNVDAYSENAPEPTRLAVSDSYPSGSYIKIEANGRYAVDHQKFEPQYPGPFTIECMGKKKTVIVSGVKWEPLGSEHFYIELRPIYNKVQIGLIESIEARFVNEYPYDVKVAHPDRIEYWFEPEGIHPGLAVYYDLVSTELIVPALGSYLIHKIDLVGVDNCTLFFKVLNQTVTMEIGVEG